MLHRTEGIVLKNFPYGEADLMVTFFTRDYGLLKVFAKSPRKLKSKFGSSLEPLTYSKVSFWGKEDAPLPRLTQSDILDPYQELREDYTCYLMLSEAMELVLNLLPERQANGKVFLLLKGILDMMRHDCNERNILLFKIRILAIKGYAPGLGACGKCGKEGLRFYKSQGSVLCDKCEPGMKGVRSATSDVIELTPGSIKLYQSLLTWELSKTLRIKASKEMLGRLTELLDGHIEHTLSKRLKSKGLQTAR